jgi:hypothetical protein
MFEWLLSFYYEIIQEVFLGLPGATTDELSDRKLVGD